MDETGERPSVDNTDNVVRWESPPFPPRRPSTLPYWRIITAPNGPDGGLARPDRVGRPTGPSPASAAMLSLSLSSPTSHHGVLLFAMLLVQLLLADRGAPLSVLSTAIAGGCAGWKRVIFAQILARAAGAGQWLGPNCSGRICAGRNS